MASRSWDQPLLIKGATTREQGIHDRAFHLVDSFDDPDQAKPIRDVLKLLAELIEGRGKRQNLEDQFDRPHDQE